MGDTLPGLLDDAPTVRSSAILSPCGSYRYRLVRQWGVGALLPFVMLNPSTADATADDPTIRRCIGFARREGADGIMVNNLFALRATDPADLLHHPDPHGPDNGRHLASLAAAPNVVCAWGAEPMAAQKGLALAAVLRRSGVRVTCLGITKQGHPRHPLYVRADQPLVEWADA